jgi:uncharacterized protein YggE
MGVKMRNRHLFAGVFLFFFSASISWAQQRDELRPLITVVGTSEVKAIPDLVDLQIGLEPRSKDLKAAFADQEANLRQVLDLNRKAGIDNRDVQTGHVDVRPVYDEQKGGRNFSHYELRKSVAITLRDPAKYDGLCIKHSKMRPCHSIGIVLLFRLLSVSRTNDDLFSRTSLSAQYFPTRRKGTDQ